MYIEANNDLLACNNTKSNYRGNINVPSAITFPWPEVDGEYPDTPDTIILCQWYVEAGLVSNYRDSGDFDDNFFTRSSRFWQGRSSQRNLVPIDYYNLFDSGIAHEVGVTLGQFMLCNHLLSPMIQMLHTRIGNFRADVAGDSSYSEHQRLKAIVPKLTNRKSGRAVELYRQTRTRTQEHRVTLASPTAHLSSDHL